MSLLFTESNLKWKALQFFVFQCKNTYLGKFCLKSKCSRPIRRQLFLIINIYGRNSWISLILCIKIFSKERFLRFLLACTVMPKFTYTCYTYLFGLSGGRARLKIVENEISINSLGKKSFFPNLTCKISNYWLKSYPVKLNCRIIINMSERNQSMFYVFLHGDC